jgi:hypothetical protein
MIEVGNLRDLYTNHGLHLNAKSKESEISGAEIVKLKWVLVCIYGSPHSDVNIFLKKLELLIDEGGKKKKGKN